MTVNVSPSVSFPRYSYRGTQGQIEQAAKVIAAVLDFKVDVDKYGNFYHRQYFIIKPLHVFVSVKL